MNDAGLSVPDDYLVASPYHDPASTSEATAQLLALADRPACILMPDDYSALGGMDAIRAAGLRIPEDISITGRRRGRIPDVPAAAHHRGAGRLPGSAAGPRPQARSPD